MIWTPPKLVNWISSDLEKRGFPPPHRFQAEQLVSYALNMSRLDIYLQHDKPCTAAEQERLRELVKRRYQREPIAYIMGNCDFWSLTLETGPGVLIPRADTEILVEAALEKIPKRNDQNACQILELGTGSAAIPLAFCAERENIEVIATEYCTAALFFAKRNICNYNRLLESKNNQILLIQTDKFSAIKPTASYDIIVTNPPYIPEGHIQTLQKEVSDWEPGVALVGGVNGTDFYEFLKRSALEYLKPSGYLIFEHGFDQSKTIMELMSSNAALILREQRKDYSGYDRVMVFQKAK